jgi:hypothetical protein
MSEIYNDAMAELVERSPDRIEAATERTTVQSLLVPGIHGSLEFKYPPTELLAESNLWK